jgi:hypothetical protein
MYVHEQPACPAHLNFRAQRRFPCACLRLELPLHLPQRGAALLPAVRRLEARRRQLGLELGYLGITRLEQLVRPAMRRARIQSSNRRRERSMAVEKQRQARYTQKLYPRPLACKTTAPSTHAQAPPPIRPPLAHLLQLQQPVLQVESLPLRRYSARGRIRHLRRDASLAYADAFSFAAAALLVAPPQALLLSKARSGGLKCGLQPLRAQRGGVGALRGGCFRSNELAL